MSNSGLFEMTGLASLYAALDRLVSLGGWVRCLDVILYKENITGVFGVIVYIV